MIDIPQQQTLEQIAQVASETEEPITARQAAAVLAAYKNILGGDPLGTMRRDPETGAIAIRVNVDGLYLWRVTVPDGTFYNDLQPTLAWPVLIPQG
jgi:hypothetical protein